MRPLPFGITDSTIDYFLIDCFGKGFQLPKVNRCGKETGTENRSEILLLIMEDHGYMPVVHTPRYTCPNQTRSGMSVDLLFLISKGVALVLCGEVAVGYGDTKS